ncbi:unnamed protein product [Blepharisma stoltei]|uniref:Uncharacterized protein n=1 Tax=Blepharisma stoltei TaxID=1481888 RepID=A0AAU9ICB0_9CILI|nr:unnamed protein product [Blepharisma stoltei]
MSKIPRTTNRNFNAEPDPKILERINLMYQTYIETSQNPLSQLGPEFNEFFKSERIISFRIKTPKALNQKGEAALQEPKLWILWMFILFLDQRDTFSNILKVCKDGFGFVKQKDALIEGLNVLLGKCPELEVKPEDEDEFGKLIGDRPSKAPKEILAVSKCGKYVLVKLAQDQQMRLKSQFAVAPIKDMEVDSSVAVLSLTKMLQRSNYSYHPSP